MTDKYIAKSLITTKGDIIYASAANTPARLEIGSAGQFLSIVNGIPTWVNNPNTHNSHAIISGTKSDGSTQIKGSASSGDITLGDSGVTAGAYGDTANQTPGYNATFKVPSISVNAKGIVTAIGEHTVKIPASDNTNTATATDNILHGSNNGTQSTYAPYAAQQSKLSFDTYTTEPTRTDILNLNG